MRCRRAAPPSFRRAVLLGFTCLAASCAPSDFDDVLRQRQDDSGGACDDGDPHDASFDAAACDMNPADGMDGGPVLDAGRGDGAAADGGQAGMDAMSDAAGDARAAERDAACDACDDSGCSDAAACEPGQMEAETEACGACNTGTRTRTRVCSAITCSWDAWGEWSSCGGVTAACTPGQTMACSPADSCGHRVCGDSCTWSSCVPIVDNGCLRRRNGTQEEGSNFRCCGDGAWQFCLPSCQWGTECTACSPDFCEC